MSLYNFSVAPGENSQIPNVCASGYVKNNSSTAIATFVIYSERNATLNKTLSPQQAFNFTNLYILRILNTSADSSCILDVIFSDTSAFSATESESVIQLGSLGSSLGNIPIEIAANSLGNIPISIDATNITGNIPIEIVANSLGNIPITIAANNIGNLPITLAANTVGNLTIDIAAQSVGNLSTDIGNYSADLQENQTGGTNILTYNPWGFSTGTNPTPSNAASSNTDMCNVQQNGASGYLTFYFNVLNPTSSSGSANITIYLYDRLPEGGPSSTPINQFTFSSGTIAAGAQAWITVNPNIYWSYNTLVVAPQQQTGTLGNKIGVAKPLAYNQINSHFWSSSYWNQHEQGFIGYWAISNTAPASLPVAVTNPIKVSEGNAASVVTSSIGITAIATVPNGKKWKILRVYCATNGDGTFPVQLNVYIIPFGLGSLFPSNVGTNENLAYINQSSASSSGYYYGYGSVVGAANLTGGFDVQAQMWSDYPILYAGDSIWGNVNNTGTKQMVQIWYVESDI